MAHDLLKFALAFAALAIVAGVIATLISGYLTAYKPGNKTVQVPQTAVSGGKAVHPSASPSPTPMAPPAGFPQYAQNQPFTPPQGQEMPPAAMEAGPMPQTEMTSPASSASPMPSAVAAPAAPSKSPVTQWYNIFQDLLSFFPGMFSGIQRAFPQWPVGWFKPL